jgi:hypothetical protein
MRLPIARVLLPLAVSAALFCALPAAAAAQAPAPRIIGGTNVAIADHPYQAYVAVDLAPGVTSVCGGSIRDATHVVTAAHCIVDSEFSGSYPQVVSPAQVSIGTGHAAVSSLLMTNVSRVSVHPGYVRFAPDALDFDVAVLTLATPLDLSGATRKALPFASAAEVTASASGFATGWGVTNSSGDLSELLQGVALPLKPDADCAAEYGSYYVPTLMLCAGGTPTGGKDTCQGDSGGPLAVDTDAGAPKLWKLAGIVSAGNGCGLPGVPAIYTRAAAPAIQALTAAADPVAAPEPPVASATVSGTARVGSTVGCNAPAVAGASPAHHLWYLVNGATLLQLGATTQSITLPAEALGARVLCDVRYENAGGFAFSDTPLAAAVGPVDAAVVVNPPAGPSVTPPAVDRTRPSSRVTRVRCRARRCTISIRASDSGGRVRALSVRVSSRVRICRRVRGRLRCVSRTRTRRLRVRVVRGGYRAVTGRLARGRHTVTVVAIDTSGNRQRRATRRAFTVR